MNTILKVPAISCHHCEMSIQKEVSKLNGVDSVIVDLTQKTVSVEHNSSVTHQMIIDAIDEAGYDVV